MLAVVALAVADGDVVQGQYRVAAVEAFEYPGHAVDQLAPGTVTQRFVFATADQQYTLCLKARQALQQQGLARFAGQVAALEYRADGTLGGLVDGLGHRAKLAIFTDCNDQGGGFYRCSSYAFYNQFHVRVPE